MYAKLYDIIQKQNNIYILENENLVEKYDTLKDLNSIEGNIYIGKIENVLKGMKIAFVNIGKEKNGILPFSDLTKKYNSREILDILRPRQRDISTS